MTATKPAIVIVPGSFSPASFYASVVDQLRGAGYSSVVVAQYPSIGRRDPAPAATMYDDAQFIHNVIETLANKGHDVLTVAHSYGGVPTSQSLEGLSKKEREAQGLVGGVVGVLYVAALTPLLGQSLGSLMDSDPASYVNVAGEYMWLEPVANAKDNFSDLSTEEGVAWAKKMPEHSTASFGGELTYAGYTDVPVSWLFTEKDRTVKPETQEVCISNIEQSSSKKVDVHRLDSGHFPFLSRSSDVSRIIRKVAGEVVELYDGIQGDICLA